jgi:hypothetical protein
LLFRVDGNLAAASKILISKPMDLILDNFVLYFCHKSDTAKCGLLN